MESREDLKAQAVQEVMGPFLLEWLAGGWLCADVGRGLKQSELGLSSFMLDRSLASGELLTAISSPPFTLSPQYWCVLLGLQWTAFALCFYLWVAICE